MYAVGARALREATPIQIRARDDRAAELRPAATAAYNVRRTIRRENGTPGARCAVRAKRRAGAGIGRKPRSWCVAATGAWPAGGSWTDLSTPSKGTSLLQCSSQPDGTQWSAASSTAWAAAVGWCGAVGTAATPSQLHALAIPASSANVHNPRTIEARNLRWRCSRRGMSSTMLPARSVADQSGCIDAGSSPDPYGAPPVTCPFAA